MFDENYYAEKEKAIHIKYVKQMERTLDDAAELLNRFFVEKVELNKELREIANRRTGADEATKPEGEEAAEETKEEVTEEAPAEEAVEESASEEKVEDGSEDVK